jgi:flagella basal body P-ring formation protein FlgA
VTRAETVGYILKFAIGLVLGAALSVVGFAAEKDEAISPKDDAVLETLVRQELSKRFNGASIEFLPGTTFPVGRTVSQVRILSESGTGMADYSVAFADGTRSIGQAHFSAMVPTFVASRRIRPGEKLSRGDFQIQSVNVAQGVAYQYRGVMLPVKEEIEALQARQTILEGQYPLTNGVEKIPDSRRGDTVEVKVVSGEIELSTMGTIQEPGYVDQNVRILTQKTKKELVGKLRKGGVVEVRL